MDGRDVGELDLRWFRQQLAVVHQEPALFSGTVAENITAGQLDATQAQVEEAARLANAHQFIVKLPLVSQYCRLFAQLPSLPWMMMMMNAPYTMVLTVTLVNLVWWSSTRRTNLN